MKLFYLALFLVFIMNCSNSKNNISINEKYINEVFQIVEKHSIKRDSINFDEIKKNAFAELKHSDSLKDCYPIVKSILHNLGDNHSFFLTSEQVNEWQSTSKTNDTNELITFSGKLLKNNIGYLHLKSFISGDSIAIQKYADSLQYKIKSIDNTNLKGWVLDLRKNSGGNCWPMLAGLGPLLGDGICGYFIGNNKTKSSWFYNYGKSGINSKTIVQVSRTPHQLFNSSNPIAILTGPETGSSGEIVVTAFHNKSNTKSFGEPTAGLTTGNADFELSDGSMIFLATSIYADRQEEVFTNRIQPDEKINFSHYIPLDFTDDPVVKAAVNWIINDSKN